MRRRKLNVIRKCTLDLSRKIEQLLPVVTTSKGYRFNEEERKE